MFEKFFGNIINKNEIFFHKSTYHVPHLEFPFAKMKVMFSIELNCPIPTLLYALQVK